MQYCREHHLHDALALHTELPAASFDAATQLVQQVLLLDWQTPMEVEVGHHMHLVVLLHNVVPSTVEAGHVA